MSDSQLAGVISNGIPDFGMPAFRLIGTAQINDVVAYLRFLQGIHTSSEWRGNPQQGRALFFGTAGCSKCHMISGEGGFLGPDLSSYGQSLTPAEIRQAITTASARNSNTKTATVVTRDGQQITGVIRDEDNFSIQLQTADGQFHFWNKAEVAKILYQSTPMMPNDYGEKLSGRDLDDIVNFLHTPKTQAKPQPETGEED